MAPINIFFWQAAKVTSRHFDVDLFIKQVRYYYTGFMWNLLLIVVFFTPGLYWRSGDELTNCLYVTPKKNTPKVTYLGVLEHHGFVSPKICVWPSFAKAFGVANAYAVATLASGRNTSINVSLIFVPQFRSVFCTRVILSAPISVFWDAVKDLTLDNYSFRSQSYNLNGALSDSWEYAHYFAFNNIPGAVHITDKTYFKLFDFISVVIPSSHKNDVWWSSTSTFDAIFGLGTN
jgi:hypothetical protein